MLILTSVVTNVFANGPASEHHAHLNNGGLFTKDFTRLAEQVEADEVKVWEEGLSKAIWQSKKLCWYELKLCHYN